MVGPSPRKSKLAASSIELPNSRMTTRNRYDAMFGAISLITIEMPRLPDRRARSTNSRDLRVNVCARTALATHGQVVRPMNAPSNMTPRVFR